MKENTPLVLSKLTIVTALINQTTSYGWQSPRAPLATDNFRSTYTSGTRYCASCHSAIRTEDLSYSFPHKARPESVTGDEFDFVIVGGVTAGCALARRLSESGRHSVLVLEYGDYPNPGLDIPALLMNYVNDSNQKFYRTVQQANAGLSNNGTFSYLIGRMLGGTSGLNGMAFNRGSPHNYHEWAIMTGDSSWSYNNLLKYFRKLEDYQGAFPSSSQHGAGGPITVSRPTYAPGLEQWFEAARYLGIPVADANGPQTISFTPTEYSKRFGRRVSSFTGYLKPLLLSRQLPNLKIIVKAEVKKIMFEGDRAIGVTYVKRDGQAQDVFVRANKEIIVSAGVLNSPLILMKSGIGPGHILEVTNIPLLKSLPVGRNLHNHMSLRLDLISGNRSATMIPERDLTADNFRLYNETGDGPYAVFPGTPGQAFLASSLSPRRDWSDYQIAMAVSASGQSVISAGFQDVQLAPWETIVNVYIRLNAPRSRGYLTLNGTHPEDGDPIINFQYLTHPHDMKVLKEAINTTLDIFEGTPVYQRMGMRYPPNPLPACSHLKFRSDAYWECFIRYNAGSSSHAVGTCSMGKEIGDPGAVVNSQLKVLGFQNLRVVDASVMPLVPNANTQAAVYVIAEKGAEMILNDWK